DKNNSAPAIHISHASPGATWRNALPVSNHPPLDLRGTGGRGISEIDLPSCACCEGGEGADLPRQKGCCSRCAPDGTHHFRMFNQGRLLHHGRRYERALRRLRNPSGGRSSFREGIVSPSQGQDVLPELSGQISTAGFSVRAGL